MSGENVGITACEERKLLFIKVGKPLIEQMKIILEIISEVKNGDGATEEIKQACEHAEKAIIRDMNMVNARLN